MENKEVFDRLFKLYVKAQVHLKNIQSWINIRAETIHAISLTDHLRYNLFSI